MGIQHEKYVKWLETTYPCMAQHIPGRVKIDRDGHRMKLMLGYLSGLLAGKCWILENERQGKNNKQGEEKKCNGGVDTDTCLICDQGQLNEKEKFFVKAAHDELKREYDAKLWTMPFLTRHAFLIKTLDSFLHMDTGGDLHIWPRILALIPKGHYDDNASSAISRDIPSLLCDNYDSRSMYAYGWTCHSKYFLILPWRQYNYSQRRRVHNYFHICHEDNKRLGRYEGAGETPTRTDLYTYLFLRGLAPLPFRGHNHLLNPTVAQIQLWPEVTGLAPLHTHQLPAKAAYAIWANVLHAVGNHPKHPRAVSAAFDGFPWTDRDIPDDGELMPYDALWSANILGCDVDE
jgi:hypothetical protein